MKIKFEKRVAEKEGGGGMGEKGQEDKRGRLKLKLCMILGTSIYI